MKNVLVAAVLLASVQPCLAETCQEKFVRVMTERNSSSEPVRIHVTQEIVGGMKSANWNLQDGKGNWRTEMIDPETMPWSMVVDNVLYSSSDKGATWKKEREMDTGASPETVAAMLAERAKSVRDAECGEEELDGAMYETVAAGYDMNGGYEVQDKYWINPDTGFIPKLVTKMKGSGFESLSTQLIEPAPGLEITKPE
ncbi:MAG: hypothetical protein LJE67_14685 [Salaquimonas sp.]|nr:hypothetical protein [Salaquimonas sp.]